MEEMRQTGIQWIGEIPTAWNTKRIKYMATLKGRIGWQGLTSEEYQDEGAYLITGVDFADGGIDWENCVHVPMKRWEEATDIQIQEGDLLITKDGTIGKVAIVTNMPGETSLNSGVLRIIPIEGYSRRFLYWVLKSDEFWNWFNYKNAGNSTIVHLYQGDFVEFLYAFPDFAEQEAIADYLDTRCNKLDKIIAAIQRQIDLLKQSKTSLIIEGVGELFFAIDPGYRGRSGEISTQYSNLHPNPDEKFYIPENVYIIGTMNDIDRSVDSFDFAMRRRFRFVELRADERLEMLALLENEELEAEAIRRMAALNKEIAAVEDLNENYQIGASYFLKLKTLDFDQLWTDYLQPLLQEYIQGMYDEEGIMKRFAKAYGYQRQSRGDVHEATQDQG